MAEQEPTPEQLAAIAAENEQSEAVNYKPPAQKTLQEIQELDQHDESLRKYKEALLGNCSVAAVCLGMHYRVLRSGWRALTSTVRLAFPGFRSRICRGDAATEILGSQRDLAEESENAEAFSRSPSAGPAASESGVGARAAVSPTRDQVPVLELSTSEEGDVLSIDADDRDLSTPSRGLGYEELVEVVDTRCGQTKHQLATT
ncbi:rho GDP-dissociation inhibitor [Pimephales promelas]|nr:rho GDP-dissociation inhibitor [Pimephales promelas]